MPDLAELAAALCGRLRLAGLPVDGERGARFVRALTVVDAESADVVRWCGLATLVSDPGQLAVFDAIFGAVFAGTEDVADWRGQAGEELPAGIGKSVVTGVSADGGVAGGEARVVEVPGLASGMERLAGRDFGELTPGELAQLAAAMRRLALHPPLRRSRRRKPSAHGHGTDLRRTLARARRTGGFPMRLSRFEMRRRPRKLVVLCDISGSMEPYARAMLQLLYCAAGGVRAEVFTFATRLTRLTPALRRTTPQRAVDRAAALAPDWSGGTRIADSLAQFNRDFGRRGMARGAVVLMVSDGWETGDPDDLGREMARLARVAHRIVWANPRTASPRYRPLVGGMAAAWPHCDAVVSAHRMDALTELVDAIADR